MSFVVELIDPRVGCHHERHKKHESMEMNWLSCLPCPNPFSSAYAFSGCRTNTSTQSEIAWDNRENPAFLIAQRQSVEPALASSIASASCFAAVGLSKKNRLVE